MTKKILKTLRSVGPSGLPRAALEKWGNKRNSDPASLDPRISLRSIFVFRIILSTERQFWATPRALPFRHLAPWC